MNIPVSPGFVLFNVHIFETKGRGIWLEARMTHLVYSWNIVWQNWVCLAFFLISVYSIPLRVCVCLFWSSFCMWRRWVITCIRCVCVCVSDRLLTFSDFKPTVPGEGGLDVSGDVAEPRWCDAVTPPPPQPAVRRHGTADRPPSPRAILPIWLFHPPSLFFFFFSCTHGAMWYLSLCIQSDKYHKVGGEGAERQRLRSRVLQWSAAIWENG